MRILEAMKVYPDAPHCSICGKREKRCLPQAVAVVCSRCACAAAERFTAPAGRRCPDCGGELTGRQVRCRDCTAKRLKEQARERVRRHRHPKNVRL